MRNPGTAAVLSFIIPGLGQLYNGRWVQAIVWIVITPGLWLGTGGIFGWVAHIISAIMAYNYAKDHPYREFD
jgi:TM2 domain-containing membrane protein YozV